jgi:hypothetical protein
MVPSTSDLLRDNCDEFIYYEDLETELRADSGDFGKVSDKQRKIFGLLLNALIALRREGKEQLWPSLVKATMRRIKPSFNETYHGYRSFSELLEDAENHRLVELAMDAKAGTYVVTRFGDEMDAPARSPRGEREDRNARDHRSKHRRGVKADPAD